MKMDRERINSIIDNLYYEYKKSLLIPGGLRREYLGILLEMAIANVDFLDVAHKPSTLKISEFSLKIAVRPMVLRAYELEMAINPWCSRLKSLAKKAGVDINFESIKLIRSNHRKERSLLLSLSKVRNTFGHSQSKIPGEFIGVIEKIDAPSLKGPFGMVLDCLTALLFVALEILPLI